MDVVSIIQVSRPFVAHVHPINYCGTRVLPSYCFGRGQECLAFRLSYTSGCRCVLRHRMIAHHALWRPKLVSKNNNKVAPVCHDNRFGLGVVCYEGSTYTHTRTNVSACILMPRAYTLTVAAWSTKLFCFCILSQFRSILFHSVPFLLSQLPCHNTGGRSMVAVQWRLLLTLFSALHSHIARQQLHIVVCSSTHDMHTCTCKKQQVT